MPKATAAAENVMNKRNPQRVEGHLVGRIANSDRAPRAWVHVAIEQANRAVQELNAI